MRIFRVLKTVSVAGGLLLPVSALAAPFCMIIAGAAPQCMYYDGRQCASDAARQNGVCDVNANEVRARSLVGSTGDYCVVTSQGGTRCGYSDGSTCGRDALAEHGVCTKAVGTGPKVRPDPYNVNANR